MNIKRSVCCLILFLFRHINSNGAGTGKREALGMGTLWGREQLYDMGSGNRCRI